jgi:hypothetical protein
MKWLSDTRRRWLFLAILWTALLILGIGGYIQQSKDAGLNRRFLDELYLTVQLATLQFGGGSTDLNWRLQVARFVAPMMAAGTVLQTASVVFSEQFQRMRASRARAHTIVCGLGDAGIRIAIAVTKAGQKVVAITDEPTSVGVRTARRHDIPVVIGDPTSPVTLRAARLDRAARLVVLTDSDSVNVDTLAAARTVPRRSTWPLRCAIQLDDAELAALLRGAELEAEGNMRVNFFNLHDMAARTWLAEHPLGAGKNRPMVLGLGQLGRSIVLAAAQRWAQDSFKTLGPLRIVIVDRYASGRWHALRLQHPGIADVCEPLLLDLDLDAPDASSVDQLLAVLRDDPPTWVAVAFEDEGLALSAALFVYHSVRPSSTPIVVRTKAAAGLAGLLGPAIADDQIPFAGMTVFPVLDRTCTADAVDAGVREQLARALHEDYLADVKIVSEMTKPWTDLTDAQREPSRHRVDGILEGIEQLSCDLEPLRQWGATSAVLTDAEIDLLARQEHMRWCKERTDAGWTWGPERNLARKHNPLIIAFDALPADVKFSNRDAVAQMPTLLARAGFEAVRRKSASGTETQPVVAQVPTWLPSGEQTADSVLAGRVPERFNR